MFKNFLKSFKEKSLFSKRNSTNQNIFYFNTNSKKRRETVKNPKGSIHETYQSPRENYQKPRENYQKPRESYQSPKENYQSPKENYQKPRESYQSPRNNYQKPRESYKSPIDNFADWNRFAQKIDINSYKKIKLDAKVNLENDDLRYMCIPIDQIINEIDKIPKWQSFFNFPGRVIPDYCRALKNKPDQYYYMFNKDFIELFSDQQLIFGIKNTLLNENPSVNYNCEILVRELNFRIKDSKFNNNSKLNIITLYEFLYHFELIEHKIRNNDSSINHLSNNIHSLIPYILDYQRFFFKDFTYEENIFILFNMIDKNLIDIFSIKRFLTEYSETKILTGLENCIYKLRYFKNEYNMNFSIFFILDRFVKTCKLNNQLDFTNNSKNFKELVHKLILKVKKYLILKKSF